MSMYTESLRAFLKPVLPYLDDESVSEIMINGPEDIWIERKGRLLKTDAKFSEEGLLGAARNMAQFVGRLLNDERPRLDARLPDGSRIHVVMPPIAKRGTTISIRKFFKEKPTVHTLMGFGSITPPMVRVVEAAISVKLNMVVSGGTGSGKTTLLNILSSLIPNEERILTIEDSAELQLSQDHLVSFESRPPDKFGKGGVDMGDLLHSALRLRPDRIVVGEVRGGECFHLMQAMNTGHGGSMATTHANTPTDTLRRLESLCLMSSVELPMVAVRAQVASAINLIVCCERLQDGSRKVTHISEVLPLNEKGEYRTQDLFVYTPIAKDENGALLGYHAPTGIIPNFLTKARAYGYADLVDSFFDPATYGVPPPPQFHLGEDYTVRWAPSLKHRAKNQPDPEEWKDDFAAFEQKLKEQARARAQAAPPPAPAPSAPPREPAPAVLSAPVPSTLIPTAPVPPAPVTQTAPAPSAPPARKAPPLSASARPQRSPPPAPARPVSEPTPPSHFDDDDKTPPPTRNPLEDMEDVQAELPPPSRLREDTRVEVEPKVELSAELLSDVQDIIDEEEEKEKEAAALPPPPRRPALSPSKSQPAPAPAPAPARAAPPAPQRRPLSPPPPAPPRPPVAVQEEDEDDEAEDAPTGSDDPDKTRIKAVPPDRLRR